MALENNDPATIRQYLLSQLTDDERLATEQRLLSDDEFFEELELTKDELVEEYLGKQLTREDSESFEQSFLASPEGKSRRKFAGALNRYVKDHRLTPPEKPTWTERFLTFWQFQPGLLKVGAAIAGLVIVVALFSTLRPVSPQTAELTLIATPITRGNGNFDWDKVKAGKDLKVTLLLPPESPGPYRIELENEPGAITNLKVSEQEAQSIKTAIPAAQLMPGRYTINLYFGKDGDQGQRSPVSYQFEIIE